MTLLSSLPDPGVADVDDQLGVDVVLFETGGAVAHPDRVDVLPLSYYQEKKLGQGAVIRIRLRKS